MGLKHGMNLNISNEDYEKCAELTNLKKNASKHKSS